MRVHIALIAILALGVSCSRGRNCASGLCPAGMEAVPVIFAGCPAAPAGGSGVGPSALQPMMNAMQPQTIYAQPYLAPHNAHGGCCARQQCGSALLAGTPFAPQFGPQPAPQFAPQLGPQPGQQYGQQTGQQLVAQQGPQCGAQPGGPNCPPSSSIITTTIPASPQPAAPLLQQPLGQPIQAPPLAGQQPLAQQAVAQPPSTLPLTSQPGQQAFGQTVPGAPVLGQNPNMAPKPLAQPASQLPLGPVSLSPVAPMTAPEVAKARIDAFTTPAEAMAFLLAETLSMAPLTSPEIAGVLDGASKALAGAQQAGQAPAILPGNALPTFNSALATVGEKVKAARGVCWANDAAECAPAFVSALNKFVALANADAAGTQAAAAESAKLAVAPMQPASPEASLKWAVGWILDGVVKGAVLPAPTTQAEAVAHPSAHAKLEALEMLLAAGFTAGEGVGTALAARTIDVTPLVGTEPPLGPDPATNAADAQAFTSALPTTGPATQAEMHVALAMRMGLYRTVSALLGRVPAGILTEVALKRVVQHSYTTPAVLAATLHALAKKPADFGLATTADVKALYGPPNLAPVATPLIAAMITLPERRGAQPTTRTDVCGAMAAVPPPSRVVPISLPPAMPNTPPAPLSPEDAVMFARAALAIVTDVPLALSATYVRRIPRDLKSPTDITNALLAEYCKQSPTVSFL